MNLFLLLAFLLPLAQADEAEDLAKELEQRQKQVQGIVDSLQKKVGGSAAAQENVEKAKQKIIALASDDKFLKNIQSLWSHPDRNQVMIYQGLFFLFMLIFKAWRQAATKNWFMRLVMGLFLSVITWVGLAFIIPWIVFGEPYKQVLITLWNVIRS